jgi:hypothetical protein
MNQPHCSLQDGEVTSAWLTRLVIMGAPGAVLAAVTENFTVAAAAAGAGTVSSR